MNLATRNATVREEQGGRDADHVEPLVEAVRGSGTAPGSTPSDGLRPTRPGRTSAGSRWRCRCRRRRSLATLTAACGAEPELAWLLSTPVVFYSGWPFLRAAARSALHGATTMDTLVALGSLSGSGHSAAAVLLGEHDHYFDTAAVIVTLILVGKVLEARARASAADASRALLDRGRSRRRC